MCPDRHGRGFFCAQNQETPQTKQIADNLNNQESKASQLEHETPKTKETLISLILSGSVESSTLGRP